jgi:hypothetical protein
VFKEAGIEFESTDETTLAAVNDEVARVVVEYRSKAKLLAALTILLARA